MSFATVRVVSADHRIAAEFVPSAGMICSSLTCDGDELLHAGKGLEAYASEGHTMGIPLLYPWANRIDGHTFDAAGARVTLPEDPALIPHDPAGLPIHGLVPARMPWQVEPSDDDSTVTARLEWSAPELLELFPFTHEAVVRAVADDRGLTISTNVRATASDRVPVSFGFHPYLRLPGSSRESWHVELPPMERLSLNERMIPTGERTPLQTEERSFELAQTSWDDGFAGVQQPARFSVANGPARTMAVELLQGYPFAQIFAPPGHDFICFEPMTAPTNALHSSDGLTVLEPGGEHRAVFRVTVEFLR
jgi:aldose 1-epimerase